MQLELDFEQATDLLDFIQSTLEGTDGSHSISHDLVNLYAVRTKLSNLLAIHAINSYGSADADSSNEPPYFERCRACDCIIEGGCIFEDGLCSDCFIELQK